MDKRRAAKVGNTESESARRLLDEEDEEEVDGEEAKTVGHRGAVVIVSDSEDDDDDDEYFDGDGGVETCADLLCSPFNLLRVGRDAALSRGGHTKAAEVGELIARDDFFRNAGVELCVHSPLQRTARTLEHALYPSFREARGTGSPMLSPMKKYGVNMYDDECSSTSSAGESEDGDKRDSDDNGDVQKVAKRTKGGAGKFVDSRRSPPWQKSMKRRETTSSSTGSADGDGKGDLVGVQSCVPFPIVCCDSLSEETPGEFLVAQWRFRRRIKTFESWLARRRENTVFVTGHSAFFKHMLGQRKKFHNCDVVRVDFTVHKADGGDGRPMTSWGHPQLIYRVVSHRP